MIIALLGFSSLGLIFLAYHYVLWYFTIYIVTNERIRQISQKSFFRKTVIDLDLSKIQSISYDIPGFSGSMFGYGTIVMQTAVGDLIISSAAYPEKVYNRLQNAVDTASRKQDNDDKENNKKDN
jgi:Bacterial membrane flanked domain.